MLLLFEEDGASLRLSSRKDDAAVVTIDAFDFNCFEFVVAIAEDGEEAAVVGWNFQAHEAAHLQMACH